MNRRGFFKRIFRLSAKSEAREKAFFAEAIKEGIPDSFYEQLWTGLNQTVQGDSEFGKAIEKAKG